MMSMMQPKHDIFEQYEAGSSMEQSFLETPNPHLPIVHLQTKPEQTTINLNNQQPKARQAGNVRKVVKINNAELNLVP